MSRFPTYFKNSRIARVVLLGLALVAMLAALIGSAGASAPKSRHVANKAANSALGEMVLTNLKGRTLYTLSSEKNGKFTCMASCVGAWPPLIVPAGTKPTGPTALGVVKRPEGKMQVTFKGRPLYTFSGDTKKGDANGEGIVSFGGTWHAASTGKISTSPPESPQPPTNPYPYGY